MKYFLLSVAVVAAVVFIWLVPVDAQNSVLSVHIRLDPETGCEYVSGSSGTTPRMEGVGLDYRHRGCRR